VDRPLTVPDQPLRQRAQPTEAAAHAEQQVGRLLGEHQRARQRPRPAELGGHHPAAAGLPVTDRDRLARLEQVELQQLAGPVDRALVGAPDQVARAELAHPVIEDRLAAPIAELLRQLAQPLRRDGRISPQLPLDPGPERVELR
jgi:hypothetical protein